MDETVRWTHLKPDEIARLLGHEGIEVSVTVVDQLLKKHNFPKPKAMKTLATGESEYHTLATGVTIPHGLYDIRDNVGYIQISTTHHTSELACDSIPYWWNTYGKVPDHGANSILL
jgi:hypothetical protein